MESNDDVQSDRPSILSAATSPTALSSLLASLLLLACAWFPHSVDGGHRPISLIALVLTTSTSENFVFRSLVLWPFEFAGFTFLGMLVLVVYRPPWVSTALLVFPIAFASVLSVRWTVLLFSGADHSRTAMIIAAVVAPWGAIVSARMLWLCRAGEVTAAAAWGQSILCVLAIFSLRWFWFQPISALHVGGVLSIVAALLMMLASWTWITRAPYDLSDRSIEPMHFRISLRQIIIAVTLSAVALTYWQVLGIWER